MELEKILSEFGFSEREAKIYLAILSLPEATIAAIVRKCKEKRSTVYSVVKELVRKNFVSEVSKNKVLSYKAVEPSRILDAFEERSALFKSLLPLFSVYMEKEGVAPKVEFYEGIEGVKSMYNDILTSLEPVKAFLGTLVFPEEIKRYIYNSYYPVKVKNNVFSQTIVADSIKNKTLIKKEKDSLYKRDRRIVAGLSFPSDIIINMYGPNKIMLVAFANNRPFGVVISSIYFYETMVSMFDFLWKLGR